MAPKRLKGVLRRPFADPGRYRAFLRKVVVNLVVGLVIAAALHHFHDLPWVRNADDGAMDWMIRMFSGAAPGRKQPIPFAFINIDEATYRDWHEPASVPRDRLLRLIDYAAAGRPLAIVVDVDVTRATGEDGRESDSDRAFAAEIEKRYAGRNIRNPPIVFARTFRPPLDPRSSALPEMRATPLDDIFKRAGNLHWASVGYDREDDGVIRRWQPWEVTCTAGEAQVWPSVQLLVAAMVRDPLQRQPGWLASQLAQHGLATCKPTADSKPSADDRLAVDGLRVSAHPSDLNRRIVYQLPWWDPAAGDPPKARPLVELAGTEVPLLSLRAALPIANPARTPPPSDGLKDHIVVIGGSFEESHDNHATPVGRMPGSMVIINSIHSLLEFDELRGPSLPVTLAIEAVLLVFISIVFAALPTIWAKLLCGLGVFVLMLPLSFLLFRGSGMWLSFALPLLAVEIHNIVADIEEAVHRGSASGHA